MATTNQGKTKGVKRKKTRQNKDTSPSTDNIGGRTPQRNKMNKGGSGAPEEGAYQRPKPGAATPSKKLAGFIGGWKQKKKRTKRRPEN